MILEKIDEVFMRVNDADEDVEHLLKDYFTFEVPGARYMPHYRKRLWDGKIRLFDLRSNRLYIGLMAYVKRFCHDNQINLELKGFDDERNVIRESCRDFAASILPPSITIRDYQIDAVQHALSRNRCFLVSPTASGKSLIIYILTRYYQLLQEKKILIIVPTTSLVEQMYGDFISYGMRRDRLHKIYSGYDKDTDLPIVISTWQSIYTQPRSYFKQFGCVIGDEAHLFKSKSLTKIMTFLTDCKYRFGFTGTLDGMEMHQLVLEGLFGNVHKVTSTRELIDKGTLSQLDINCVVLKHSKEESKRVKKYTYAEELNYIVSHKKRNDFIKKLGETVKGNTLILFQLVEKHGKILYDMIKDVDKRVFFVYGNTETKTREEIRGIVEKETNAIIIASYGTFSTGINIRNLHNIVFASPSKSRIRVLQSIGRGLRRGDKKSSVVVYDIADDITYLSRTNFTYRHFRQRLNIYGQEKLNYKVEKVRLNE